MSDENTIAAAAGSEGESEGRPFGYIDPETETAMICEQDNVRRDKIASELKQLGYAVVEPANGREALKFMRFHIFSAVFVDEDFDTRSGEVNGILKYLEGLSMAIRRQTFVVLVSGSLKTMDNMMGYNKSVNLIINKDEIGDVGHILKKALMEHDTFYHVFKENLRKLGKI
jgi:CheY-like chemotaxis protein